MRQSLGGKKPTGAKYGVEAPESEGNALKMKHPDFASPLAEVFGNGLR
jgi:hypothetical protein